MNAQRADLPDNVRYGRLLQAWANGSEPIGVPDLVLSGFLRVVTNRRIFAEPTQTPEATFISADRGFARFSRLRWRHPLDS